MNKKSGVMGGALLAVLSATAHSQSVGNPAPVHSLGVIEVQGQAVEQLPEGSSRITRTELENRGIEDWEDFGRRGNAAVSFDRNSDSVNVRGMDEDRVTTRIDGIRLPWLVAGPRSVQGGLSSIDFNSLSAVDLVGGAGSTSSGSLTGYLDLRTLSPDDLLPPGQDFGALLKGGYDTTDEGWDINAALAGRLSNQNTRWLLQAGLRRGHELDNQGSVGGYGRTREKLDPASTKQHNFMLKLEHDINAEHSLTFAGETFKLRSDIDSMSQQGTTYGIGMFDSTEELNRNRVWAGWAYRSKDPQALFGHADLKVYWQESELHGIQDSVRLGPWPTGPYGRHNTVRERNHGVIGEWGGAFAGAGLQHRWSMGAEWYATRSVQNSSGYDSCHLNPTGGQCLFLGTNQADVPEVKGNTYALWLQDEISWAEGRYAVVPALRYDYYSLKPQMGGNYQNNPNVDINSVSDNGKGRFSPSLMVKMQASQDLLLYAKYGYGFKAPNASQLYMNYGSPGLYLRKGDPNMRPEISRGWELGLEYGTAKRGFQVSVYDNRYRDFIEQSVRLNPSSPEWDPNWSSLYPMGVFSYLNRSRVRIYGAELSGHWEFNPNWYTWGSVAWAHGKDQETDTHINSVAPLRALLGLGYRQEQWGGEALFTLVRNHNKVANPATDFQAPGYGLLDLTAWWKPQAVKGLKVRAGVYNAFDKKYWNPVNTGIAAPHDYYTEPGRNFRISLTYQY